MASGVTRLGMVAKLVPVSVIAGFTTGVGTLIMAGQVPKALGLAAPAGLNPVEVMGFVGSNVASISPAAATLALGTSAAMFLLPKVHPKIPSALLAVGGATVATHTLGLDVSLIGTIPSGLEAFAFAVPSLPSVDSIPSLAATTLLIFGMTSAESLLSCAALEKMKKTSYKHNPDQELVGQGLANVGAGMFFGMPVTSVIARSSLNVRLNAESRLPALVQAGFVFSSVVFFSDSIAKIPMPALSGMLITAGLGMLNPAEFKHCYAVQKSDAVPFATTIAGMLSMGLAEGIGIGCVTALALNHGQKTLAPTKLEVNEHRFRNKQEVAGFVDKQQGENRDVQTHDDGTTVWKLNGPINFVSMFAIDDMVQRIGQQVDGNSKSIVLDMKGVTSVEFTGIEELSNRLIEVARDHQNPIQMLNCNESLQNAMDHCDPTAKITCFPAYIDLPDVSSEARSSK